MFTHGNQASTGTAPEIRPWDWGTELQMRAGFACVVAKPEPKLDRSEWRTADEKARRGGVCPGCGLERPLVGQCNNCW